MLLPPEQPYRLLAGAIARCGDWHLLVSQCLFRVQPLGAGGGSLSPYGPGPAQQQVDRPASVCRYHRAWPDAYRAGEPLHIIQFIEHLREIFRAPGNAVTRPAEDHIEVVSVSLVQHSIERLATGGQAPGRAHFQPGLASRRAEGPEEAKSKRAVVGQRRVMRAASARACQPCLELRLRRTYA